MRIIDSSKNIKEQLKEQHLCCPTLKYNKKYGLKGSTSLDRSTEEECMKATLEYLEVRNIIKVI